MKKLQNLKGAKALNKKEQQSINGGAPGGGSCCDPVNSCCIPQPIAFQLALSVMEGGCGQQGDPGCQYAYGDPNCFQHPYWTGCI